MTVSIRLPKTPKVVSRDKTIIVCFSNGSELVWDTVETEEEANKVAKELEVELQAVKYVQWHVRNFIHDMREYLKSLDIDEKLLDSILIDGHAYAREELDMETVDSILFSNEEEKRKQVLNHIGMDDFVV